MLDIKRIREDYEGVKAAVERRCKGDFGIENVVKYDEKRREILAEVEQMKNKQNTVSKEIPKLKKAGEEGRINFIGNVEGTDVYAGRADVVVTDGFTGNVMLKATEGTIKYIMKQLKGVFYKNTKNKLAAAVLKKDLGIMKKSMDVNEVGGTALVGISRPVIKAHGSSNAASIFAAVRQAVAFVNAGIIGDIENNIDYMRINTENNGEA